MNATVRVSDTVIGQASDRLLSGNIEVYENTVPAMLSDRLRNGKFAGPENPQTGLAAEWGPMGNGMPGFSCRLVPGMYLSGREAQLIHVYAGEVPGAIVQAGVHVRAGEQFEVEMWARVQHRPVTVTIGLRLPGCETPKECSAEMTFDQAHWHRQTCRIGSPGTGDAAVFCITVPPGGRIVIDQVHLRPFGQPHVSPALLDAFGLFPCPVLRFPGGCVSCAYHWEHGIGPVHLRPVCDDPVFRYKLHYDFGTDEYLALCAARGITPFITLNTSTATPEQAAGWAAYIRDWYASRGRPIPAAYFMFGNENYWIHEIGHMTGPMYVAQLRQFVPAVRSAYPEARMVAIGEYESAGLQAGGQTPWRSLLLEQAAEFFDVLAVTRYSYGADSLSPAATMERLADNLAEKEADLARQAQSIRDAGFDRTMAIVEWNYWTRASHYDHAGFHEPNDIRHCLYAAGYLNALCRLGGIVELANFYSTVNTMGMIHVHDGQVALTDVVKVFNLYADALPGEVLRLDVQSPPLTKHRPAVDANFVRRDGRGYGFLANLSAAERVDVAIAGIGKISGAAGLSASGILQPVQECAPMVANNIVTLPPMSLVRLTSEA